MPAVPVTVEERIYQGVGTTWIVRGGGGERFVVWEQNAVSASTSPPPSTPAARRSSAGIRGMRSGCTRRTEE